MKSLLSEKINAALNYRKSIGKTTQNYYYSLCHFDRFCVEYYPNLSCVTKELAWAWVYQISNTESLNIRSRISAINFLSGYLKSLGEEAYTFPDAMLSYRYHPHPYMFTDEELSRLFSAMDHYPYSKNSPLRHKIVPVAFRLIYTCGLRPNEGRQLKQKHINLDNGEILITATKQDRERIIVMSDDMLELCCQYASYKKHVGHDTKSEYFFPTPSGNCYTRDAFSKMFRKCWQLANPDVTNLPRVRIYDLRHRFASAVLNKWTDEKRDLSAMLPYLRTYMGHRDLSSTEYYIHLLPEKLIKSSGIGWDVLEKIIPEVTTHE